MNKPSTVIEYLDQFPIEVRDVLMQLRGIILNASAGTEEKISWNMPGYKIYGKPLVYFAAHKKHIGFYPADPLCIEPYVNAGFVCTKGSVHFHYNNPLPVALIKQTLKLRITQNSVKKKA